MIIYYNANIGRLLYNLLLCINFGAEIIRQVEETWRKKGHVVEHTVEI